MDVVVAWINVVFTERKVAKKREAKEAMKRRCGERGGVLRLEKEVEPCYDGENTTETENM